MKEQNNIFHYATSELSQDAFLCWLFSYALKDADNDAALNSCAIDFLKQFIDTSQNTNDIWLSEEPKRQYKNIDILLTVNNHYKIIIEDKTYTNEHDNQLKRYYDLIQKEFPKYEVRAIYFKTGFQSNLNAINSSKYKFFGLEDIITTLQKYVNKTQNAIFLNYYEYLKRFYERIQQYKTQPVCSWNWEQINGFYESIKNDKTILQGMNCDYGYVANQSGGFYGMWLTDNSIYKFNEEDYELYLQCEFSNGNFSICYKANNKSGNKIYKGAREYFTWRENNRWVNVAENHHFLRPSHYGCGKTVTLGFYSDELHSNQLTNETVKEILKNAIKDYRNTIKELSLH